MADNAKPDRPDADGADIGTPAGTAWDNSQRRPNIGDAKSGKANLEKTKATPTEPLAPEAKGGAGAGRKWPGDS